MICSAGSVRRRLNPGKHVLDHVDHTGSSRQVDLSIGHANNRVDWGYHLDGIYDEQDLTCLTRATVGVYLGFLRLVLA